MDPGVKMTVLDDIYEMAAKRGAAYREQQSIKRKEKLAEMKESDPDKYNALSESKGRSSATRAAKGRAFIIRVKTISGCYICGYRACGAAMDFHHVTDDKDRSVSSMCARHRDDIKAEMRKCVVLCSNCHREVHAGFTDLDAPC